MIDRAFCRQIVAKFAFKWPDSYRYCNPKLNTPGKKSFENRRNNSHSSPDVARRLHET